MRLFMLLCTVLAACRSEEGVKVYNSLPQVTITSHADDSSLLEGETLVFVGQVSDINHENEELTVFFL